jgi:hypothetical protein
MIEKEIPQSERDAYEQVIDYLANKNDAEMIGIALETAKSNPEFFIRALTKVRSTGEIILQNSGIWLPSATQSISPAELIGVIIFVGHKKMVQAIKELRSYNGQGLKEAKDVCDAIRGQINTVFVFNKDYDPINDWHNLSPASTTLLIGYVRNHCAR